MENKTKDMKQTPLTKAIAEIEARIKYLREQELIALTEIDIIVSPSLVRDMKWKLINELAARRVELEMYSLKPLQSLLPYERECIEQAVKDNIPSLNILTEQNLSDIAKDYFTSTYKQ